MKFSIIKHRTIWFSFSGILVAASIIALALWGLKIGIDFTGGTSLDITFLSKRPATVEVQRSLADLKLGEISVSPVGEKSVTIRTRPLEDKDHTSLLQALNEAFKEEGKSDSAVREDQFQTVGPVIGTELRNKTIWAIIFAIFGIVLLITWTFRKVSYPVKSWKYGVVTIVALVHDVMIPTGAFALFGKLYGFEANALLVVALLTILGFSVHDTIVVFDRTRENLQKHRSLSFQEVVDKSLHETFIRSLNTSFTLVLILATALLFGGQTIRDFILTLLIGVVFGTYSSIFIASPLLVTWYERERGNRQ